MKHFRGLPKQSAQFKKHCKKHDLKYTQDLCKEALKDLFLNGSPYYLKTHYGDKILGCFNKRELDKFLKKDELKQIPKAEIKNMPKDELKN